MKKYLTINELLAQGPTDPVYVINSSAKSEYTRGQRGEVLLVIPQIHGNGDPTKHTVRQTWLAEDLTNFVPRAALLQSTEFRRAVNMGLIQPITVEYAQYLEQRPGYNEEVRRLRERQNNIDQVSAPRTIAQSGAEVSRADGVKDDENDVQIIDNDGRSVHSSELNTAQAAAKGLDLVDGLEPAFTMWADRLQSQPDVDALNSIRSYGGMKKRQLKYLRRVLINHPKSLAKVNARIQKIDEKRA